MKLTAEDKAILREEYAKVWKKDKHMIDYCVNKASALIHLHDCIVVFDKPSIETRFCFGESGYDYEEVQNTCHAMSKSETYFLTENMGSTYAYSLLKCIQDDYPIYIKHNTYYNQPDSCIIGHLQAYTPYEARFGEPEGELISGDDLQALIQVLSEEQEKFYKRLQTYLKRYGLSKCRYWTYWLDA